MTLLRAADIVGAGMVAPVGVTAQTAAAALRAGLSRVRETSLRDSQFEPLVAGFLEDEYLPPLSAELRDVMKGMTARHLRLVRLAAAALQEAAAGSDSPLPLILALPESHPWGDPVGAAFLKHLAAQSHVKLDVAASKVLRQGRAGGLLAVQHAMELLTARKAQQVLVGGVDTYLDPMLLANLDVQGRLNTRERLTDGFIPGEGAAFLLLSRGREAAPQARLPLAQIVAVGTGQEPGHLYSVEPYQGEGLAQAFHQLFEHLPVRFPKVRTAYAGLNGENFWAKEWGVAYLRHTQRFEPGLRLEHPAEYTGDMGAALGPAMLVSAAVGLQRGYRQGPCLVWCSSDREQRAAVVLQATAKEVRHGH
jgi:3-oxoacyl-[acyl-carrier-protein] synthase I